jgi:putative transposase
VNIENKNKEYSTENHVVYSCQYHVVFCPKYRRSVLVGEIEKRLKELILEKQEEYGYKVIEQEIMPEHVHLLLDVSPIVGIFTIVNKIKGYTSRTLRSEFPELVKKLPTMWSISKFISSVGSVSLETVKRYIENQKNV